MDISIFSRGIKVVVDTRFGTIEQMTPPAKATVILRQSIAAECKPTVTKGSKVKVGQQIAEATGAFYNKGADLHAPISGVVQGLEEVIETDGTKGQAIVIETDNKDEWETFNIQPSVDIIDSIRKAGITLAGKNAGALSDVLDAALTERGRDATTGKPIARRVDNLAIRFCDVDPYLGTMTSVANVLGDKFDDLQNGIEALQKATNAKNVCLVLGKNSKLDALEKFAADKDYQVVKVDNAQYPYAADPFVAQQVSGKESRVTFNAVHESGTIVLDIVAVLEVAKAIKDGIPSVEKTITVLGPKGPKICNVRIGTPISAIIDELKIEGEFKKIILEGPLGGVAVHTIDFPVTKNLSGITLIPADDTADFKNESCISCGLCSAVCPIRLIPGMLSRFCEFGQWEQAENAHLFNCIECGSCAYVCPAGRSMVQFMILGKSELLAARRAK